MRACLLACLLLELTGYQCPHGCCQHPCQRALCLTLWHCFSCQRGPTLQHPGPHCLRDVQVLWESAVRCIRGEWTQWVKCCCFACVLLVLYLDTHAPWVLVVPLHPLDLSGFPLPWTLPNHIETKQFSYMKEHWAQNYSSMFWGMWCKDVGCLVSCRLVPTLYSCCCPAGDDLVEVPHCESTISIAILCIQVILKILFRYDMLPSLCNATPNHLP